MKKLLLVMLFIPLISFGQDYSSKRQSINNINGVYSEGINKLYFNISDGVVTQYLNKKMKKVFETHKIGVTENDDWKIKWSFDKDKLELTKRGIDTFTEKSYKIVYHLTPHQKK